MSNSAKFTGTTQSHTHPNTPKVYYGATPPTSGMMKGDIWVKTESAFVRTEDTGRNKVHIQQ